MARIELEELGQGDKTSEAMEVIYTVNQYMNIYQISIYVAKRWEQGLITRKQINRDNTANILRGKVN